MIPVCFVPCASSPASQFVYCQMFGQRFFAVTQEMLLGLLNKAHSQSCADGRVPWPACVATPRAPSAQPGLRSGMLRTELWLSNAQSASCPPAGKLQAASVSLLTLLWEWCYNSSYAYGVSYQDSFGTNLEESFCSDVHPMHDGLCLSTC